MNVYDDFILSSSTDRTIRLWKKAEGRQGLMYPWFELQVRRGFREELCDMCNTQATEKERGEDIQRMLGYLICLERIFRGCSDT